MRSSAWLSMTALVLLPALPASAGLVRPGQSVSLTADNVPAPTGTLVERKSTDFTIDYGSLTAPFGDSAKLHGTLFSAVYRGENGRLTFVYDIDLDHRSSMAGGASEASELRIGSFKSFKTSLFGSMDFDQIIRGSRSQNGSQLWVSGNSPGLGGAPRMVVKTDATAYDGNGHASFFAADELPTLAGSRMASGVANFSGMFRPITVTAMPPPPPPTNSGGGTTTTGGGEPSVGGGGTGPTPSAVPLPSAAYSAMGVFLAMGLIALTRRGWTTHK